MAVGFVCELRKDPALSPLNLASQKGSQPNVAEGQQIGKVRMGRFLHGSQGLPCPLRPMIITGSVFDLPKLSRRSRRGTKQVTWTTLASGGWMTILFIPLVNPGGFVRRGASKSEGSRSGTVCPLVNLWLRPGFLPFARAGSMVSLQFFCVRSGQAPLSAPRPKIASMICPCSILEDKGSTSGGRLADCAAERGKERETRCQASANSGEVQVTADGKVTRRHEASALSRRQVQPFVPLCLAGSLSKWSIGWDPFFKL